MKEVRVRYFAVFREQAGIAHETVLTNSDTLCELYLELGARHGFALAPQDVKASLNLEWADLGTEFQTGDEVVFIPPVAGG